jgi:hypothetical protein
MMSNTKQQIREMISDFGEDSISYGEELHTGRVKSDDEIKSDSAELLRKQTEIVEAIDRLVTDARIDELKHIVSNSEWSDDDFYWYEVTREEYEGTKYYSEVRHLKRGQRIAELQFQLTNKDTK